MTPAESQDENKRLRRVRLRAANKIRVEISNAVHREFLEKEFDAEVVKAVPKSVDKIIQRCVKAEMDKIDIPKMVRQIVTSMMEAAIKERGGYATTDIVGMQIINHEITKMAQEFIKERLVMRLIEPNKGDW